MSFAKFIVTCVCTSKVYFITTRCNIHLKSIFSSLKKKNYAVGNLLSATLFNNGCIFSSRRRAYWRRSFLSYTMNAHVTAQVTATAATTTIPPSTTAPAAVPPPPLATLPPPSHAKIALLAAAPDKVEIAVPVPQVPNAATNEVVAVPANAPPAMPAVPAIKSRFASFHEAYPIKAAPYDVMAVVTKPPAVPAREFRNREKVLKPAICAILSRSKNSSFLLFSAN